MNKRKLLQTTLAFAVAATLAGGALAQDKPLKIGESWRVSGTSAKRQPMCACQKHP